MLSLRHTIGSVLSLRQQQGIVDISKSQQHERKSDRQRKISRDCDKSETVSGRNEKVTARER